MHTQSIVRLAGRTAALVLAGGLLAACAADWMYADTLTSRDRQLMERTTQETLERNQVGQSANWNNPDTGHLGAVTPLRNLQAGVGQPCRDYQMTVTLSPDRTQTARYTACRQLNGSWVNRETANLAGSHFEGQPSALEPGVARVPAPLSPEEQRLATRAAQVALESNRAGQAEIWRDPVTGRQGAVTPLDTYQAGALQPCRNYEMSITTGGATEVARYTACRRSDGAWLNRADSTLAGSRFDGGTYAQPSPPYVEPPYYGSPPGYPSRPPVWP